MKTCVGFPTSHKPGVVAWMCSQYLSEAGRSVVEGHWPHTAQGLGYMKPFLKIQNTRQHPPPKQKKKKNLKKQEAGLGRENFGRNNVGSCVGYWWN